MHFELSILKFLQNRLLYKKRIALICLEERNEIFVKNAIRFIRSFTGVLENNSAYKAVFKSRSIQRPENRDRALRGDGGSLYEKTCQSRDEDYVTRLQFYDGLAVN